MAAPSARPSAVLAALTANRLGVFDVIMFALTAAAPLMVVGGVVTTGWAVTGTTGFPLAFLVMGGLLITPSGPRGRRARTPDRPVRCRLATGMKVHR